MYNGGYCICGKVIEEPEAGVLYAIDTTIKPPSLVHLSTFHSPKSGKLYERKHKNEKGVEKTCHVYCLEELEKIVNGVESRREQDEKKQYGKNHLYKSSLEWACKTADLDRFLQILDEFYPIHSVEAKKAIADTRAVLQMPKKKRLNAVFEGKSIPLSKAQRPLIKTVVCTGPVIETQLNFYLQENFVRFLVVPTRYQGVVALHLPNSHSSYINRQYGLYLPKTIALGIVRFGKDFAQLAYDVVIFADKQAPCTIEVCEFLYTQLMNKQDALLRIPHLSALLRSLQPRLRIKKERDTFYVAVCNALSNTPVKLKSRVV